MQHFIHMIANVFICVHVGRSTWQGLMWDMPPHIHRHAVETGQL